MNVHPPCQDVNTLFTIFRKLLPGTDPHRHKNAFRFPPSVADLPTCRLAICSRIDTISVPHLAAAPIASHYGQTIGRECPVRGQIGEEESETERDAPGAEGLSTGASSTRATRVRRRDRKDAMDSSRFDTLVRLITADASDASRRGLLRSAFAATIAGLGAASLLGAEDAEAKSCKAKCKKKKSNNARKKCKKKCDQNGNNAQCKTSGAKCKEGSNECCSAQNLICEVPIGGSSSDTYCCGGTGSPCGGADHSQRLHRNHVVRGRRRTDVRPNDHVVWRVTRQRPHRRGVSRAGRRVVG